MARINIEDDLETHDEFRALLSVVGDWDAALGKLVRFFRLCQKRYTEDGSAVSKEYLAKAGLTCMIDTGWALPFKDGYQVAKPEKHFAWICELKERNSRAGKISAERRREKYGSAQPVNPNISRTSPEHMFEVFAEHSNAPTLTPTLTQNTKTCASDDARDSEEEGLDFETLYRTYPNKRGKKRGLEQCRKKIKTQEDLENLGRAIVNYGRVCRAEGREPRYIKHFSSFMSEWEEWVDIDPEAVGVRKAMVLDFGFEGA